MKISNFKFQISKVLGPLLIVIFAVILRVLPHPPNVAPIAAMALFGGAYLDKRYALIVPLVALFLSDLIIGLHDTMLFVYGSFVLSGFIGMWLRRHKTVVNAIAATLISSLLFFFVTNFGVWLVSGMYEHTIFGLTRAYTLALPFFRNTIVGDLFYVALFFGTYEFLLKNVKSVSLKFR